MTDGKSDRPSGMDKIVIIYQEALMALGGNSAPLHYGPAHVVWDDANYDFAEVCLADFDKRAADSQWSKAQLDIVKQSLVKLVTIPLSDREWPDEDVHA